MGDGGVHGAEAEPFEAALDVAARLLANVETVVRGKTQEVQLVLAALGCGGHVLVEDVPGTAKTVLARAIAQSIAGASASRIQCTPDLQPTDVTGLEIFDQRSRQFEFRPGPVFANIVLVDEINRAMPKTQSALLEAMAERQVTVDGVTRRLPEPFLLLATENPIEQEGTFPLPEAQLDRFYVRMTLGYPALVDEVQIVAEQQFGHPLGDLQSVADARDLRILRSAIERVYVDPLVQHWLVELVRATRALDHVELGASVRGSLALIKVARAWALLHGRRYVTPEDVELLFVSVIGHRVLFDPVHLAETQELSEAHRLSLLRDECLTVAPPPAPQPDGPSPPPRGRSFRGVAAERT